MFHQVSLVRLTSGVLAVFMAAGCSWMGGDLGEDRSGSLDDWLASQSSPAPGDPTPGGDSASSVPPGDTDGEGEFEEVYCTPADDNQPCELTNGETGLTRCLASALNCFVCQPGEERDASCGCGIAREDSCTEDGRWRKGVCDSCTSDPAPIPCGFCGEVNAATGECVGGGSCIPTSQNPLSVRYERCDSCPHPDGCAPGSCIGKKSICNDSCEWELVEDCAVRAPQCDGELRRIERCGVCGDMTIACDGCFWGWPSECDNAEQECYPGEARNVDCFGNGCREGYRSTISCASDCKWRPPTPCVGCSEGWHTEWQNCVYNRPQCGKKEIQYYCTVPGPTGVCDVPLGTKGQFTTLQECPEIDCYPGQTIVQNCLLGDGRGGFQTKVCRSDCTWPDVPTNCVPGGTSCPIGTVKTSSIDCGCGKSYTKTETCNSSGTGWIVNETGKQDCPPCKPGQSVENLGCQVSGTCGTKDKTCSSQCQWVEGTCDQANWACYNGDTKQGSCWGSCGSGTATFTCMGCSWVQSTSCFPGSQPECSPGQARDLECVPGVPQCGSRSEFCSSTCQWVGETCPPCG